MKNKITIITTLVITLLVVAVFSVKAEDGEKKNEDRNRVNIQLTGPIGNEGGAIDNEDEMDSEDEMDNEDEMDSEDEMDNEDEMDSEDEMDNEDEMDSEDDMDNEDEIDSQDEVDMEDQMDNSDEEEDDYEKVSDERKSNVSSALEEILKVTENNKDVGEEVKTIALDQVVNQDAIEESLKEVDSRGGFLEFLIGPNYSIINNAKKLIEKNKEYIIKLNDIKTKIANVVDAQKITNQVSVLEQSSKQVEEYVKQSEQAFSLFGWLSRIFSK